MFLYVGSVRTSHETYVRASTACYEDSLTFLYLDGVRTSQETHIRACTTCYGVSFTLYMKMMFVPHRRHTYGPPRPVTWIVLLFYIPVMFIPHRKPMHGPPRPVTMMVLRLLYTTSLHYVMKMYGEMDVSIHDFFISILVGRERSASRRSCFTRGESPRCLLIGLCWAPELIELGACFALFISDLLFLCL
jgi:hypothetical protein